MFGKIKNYAARKLMERQLKDAPTEQKELIMTMFEKDPELMEQIAKEIKAEEKKGKSQMQAAMTVMPKYQARLQKLMGNKVPQHGDGAQFRPDGTIHK